MASEVGSEFWGHTVPINRDRWATFDYGHDLKNTFKYFLYPVMHYTSKAIHNSSNLNFCKKKRRSIYLNFVKSCPKVRNTIFQTSSPYRRDTLSRSKNQGKYAISNFCPEQLQFQNLHYGDLSSEVVKVEILGGLHPQGQKFLGGLIALIWGMKIQSLDNI